MKAQTPIVHDESDDEEEKEPERDKDKAANRATAMAELAEATNAVRRKSQSVTEATALTRSLRSDVDKAIVSIDVKMAKERWRLAMLAVKTKVRMSGGRRADGRRISITDPKR